MANEIPGTEMRAMPAPSCHGPRTNDWKERVAAAHERIKGASTHPAQPQPAPVSVDPAREARNFAYGSGLAAAEPFFRRMFELERTVAALVQRIADLERTNTTPAHIANANVERRATITA